MVEFRVQLRKVRMEKKKTQKQTAEVLGMKLRSYQFYEQGTVEPSIKKLITLADFFDVSLDYLMGRTDS
ncbi:MAG: helix-turn-helix transcriptional regulator [Oscillospiraceae bacterium]|nr:helix-turn-helix transcriptional regulator [Oscillospiraceae bacterium]